LNRFAVAGWIVPLWLCVFFFSPGAMTGQTLIQSSPGTRLEEGMLSSLRQVAQSLERNGQIDQALDLLLQYSQDLRVLAYIGQICDKNGMQAQFLPLAAGAYQREPGNPEALVLYIKALHSQNLQDSLLAVTLRFLDSVQPEAAAFQLISNQYRALDMQQEALQLLERARRQLNNPALFRLEMADLLIDLEHWERGINEAFSMLETDRTTFVQVQRLLHRVLDSSGEPGGRLVSRTLEKRMDKAGGSALKDSYGRLLIDVRLTMDQEREAFDLLDKMARSLPQPAARDLITIFLGRAQKLEKNETVLVAYSLADSLKLMERDRILLGRATAYGQMERYHDMERELLSLIALEPPAPALPEAMNRLGGLYLNHLDQPAQALDWFRRLENLNPEHRELNIQARLSILESFIRLDSLDAARTLCDEMLAAIDLQNPVQPVLLRLRADVLLYSGQADSAATVYISSARLSLNQPLTNDAIERAWLIRSDTSPDKAVTRLLSEALHRAAGGDADGAAILLRQACEAAQDSTCRVRLSGELGRMYERAEKFPLAAAVYEDILRSAPQHYLSAEIELRLALLLLNEIGDREGARRHLENIVLNRPEGVITPEARRLMRSMEEPKL